MKAAIMQPYFFPYLGYFSLIKHTDRFILLDAVQFIYHGWIERNRILKPDGGWMYIKIPLEKHSSSAPIRDVRVDNAARWGDKILASLGHYKKRAPYYGEVYALCEKVFREPHADITSLNASAMKAVLEYLDIDRNIEIFTRMGIEIETPGAADEWSLNICKSLGNIEEYRNPPGGKSFFSRDKYENAGITLRFHEINLKSYDQKRQVFEPGLSIVDALMFNSPAEMNGMLDDFTLS